MCITVSGTLGTEQIPKTLCPALLAYNADAILRIPLARPGSTRSDLRFNLDGVIVLLCDSPAPTTALLWIGAESSPPLNKHNAYCYTSPAKRSVMLISKSALCEHACVAFKRARLGRVVRAANVALDDELPHDVRRTTEGYVCQHLVKLFYLVLPVLIRDDPSVLAEASEVKLLERWDHDERSLARGRWQLLTVRGTRRCTTRCSHTRPRMAF